MDIRVALDNTFSEKKAPHVKSCCILGANKGKNTIALLSGKKNEKKP